jgi:hypothetical protein
MAQAISLAIYLALYCAGLGLMVIIVEAVTIRDIF